MDNQNPTKNLSDEIKNLPTLSDNQKKKITKIFNNIFQKQSTEKYCKNDVILNGYNITEYLKYLNLKMKLGFFYEQLFCYLGNFYKPRKGYDLRCDDRKIIIEIKTSFKTDNHNSKDSKFHHLGKFKLNNPDWEVIYMCLNDHRDQKGVDYIHYYNFRIISGDLAWKYFCNIANIDYRELINFIRNLVHNSLQYKKL